MAGTFVRWTTEGQLLTVVMAIVFVTWLGFQIFVAPLDRPTILNEVLLAVLGAWSTNLFYGVKKRDERAEKEEEDAENDRVERKVADALAKRQGNN